MNLSSFFKLLRHLFIYDISLNNQDLVIPAVVITKCLNLIKLVVRD